MSDKSINWRELAVSLRTTIEHLTDIESVRCLPGEDERGECHGSDTDHVAAFIGRLMALLEHYAHHLPEVPGIGSALGRVYSVYACEYTNHCTSHPAQAGQLLEALGQRAMTNHPVDGVHSE